MFSFTNHTVNKFVLQIIEQIEKLKKRYLNDKEKSKIFLYLKNIFSKEIVRFHVLESKQRIWIFENEARLKEKQQYNKRWFDIALLSDFFYNTIAYNLIQNIKFKNDIVDRRVKFIEHNINNLVFKICDLLFQNIINAQSFVSIEKFTIFVFEFRNLFVFDSTSAFTNKNVFHKN